MPSIDAVFTDSWGTAGTGTDKDIVFDASNDPGALARAEWIKFMALFFNEEERANLYFDREKAAFEYTSALAATAAGSTTKKCAWVSLSLGSYVLDFTTYKTEFCRAAGMTPVTDAALVSAGTYTKTFADKAAFVAALADYDVVIDETYIASPANANADKAAVLAKLDVVESDFKTGAILLRVDRHLGDVESTTDHATHTMDWYESALPRPALVLMDLAHLVWPDAFPVPAAGCARYFRNIFSDTITTAHRERQGAVRRLVRRRVGGEVPHQRRAGHGPVPLRQRRTGRREASRRHRRRRHRRRDAPRVIARARERRPNGVSIDLFYFHFVPGAATRRRTLRRLERAPRSIPRRSIGLARSM